MKRLAFLAFALAAVVPPTVASAQTRQKLSFQASGLYAGLGGDAYEGLTSGPGGEAQIRYTPGAFSLGLGVQYTSHDVKSDPFVGTSSMVGVFAEPRYVLPLNSSWVFPYVSARLAVVRLGISVSGIEAHGTGSQLNAGGGVLIRLATNLNLDVGATMGRIDIGKQTVDRKPENVDVEGSSPSGRDLFLRIGLAVGIGSR
jgi:hypothetical protein